MCDMIDKITGKLFLEECMKIEGLCVDLYNFYSDIYDEIPGASTIWMKAALEDEKHQKQFELALRLVSETEFEVSKDNMKRAFLIYSNLIKFMKYVKGSKPEILIALSKAVALEEILENLHVHSSLKFREESMQNLFKAMSNNDRDHVAALKRYWTILYLPQSEMEQEYWQDNLIAA